MKLPSNYRSDVQPRDPPELPAPDRADGGEEILDRLPCNAFRDEHETRRVIRARPRGKLDRQSESLPQELPGSNGSGRRTKIGSIAEGPRLEGPPQTCERRLEIVALGPLADGLAHSSPLSSS